MSRSTSLIGILIVLALVVAIAIVSASKDTATGTTAAPESRPPGDPANDVAGRSSESSPGREVVAPGEESGQGAGRPPSNPTIDRYGVPVSTSAPVPPGANGSGQTGENDTNPGNVHSDLPVVLLPAVRRTGDEAPANVGEDPGIYGDTSEFVDSDYVGPAPEDSGPALPPMPAPEEGAVSYDVPPEGSGSDVDGPPPEGPRRDD